MTRDIPRKVQCAKLGKEAPGLARPPCPGALGKRIHEQVSQQAWAMWERHQTMLINEQRLSGANPEHRRYLKAQMEAFLFGGEFDRPRGLVPPSQ